jgi:hypothetical protein
MVQGTPSVALLAALALASMLPVPAAPAAEIGPAVAVDLELVIAVDVSRSMDDEEFRLQRAGYIEAIRHPDFLRAVASGNYRRIALTYAEWSSRLSQKIVVPWRLIDGEDAAEAFAPALSRQPFDIGRGTSISAAIDFSAGLFEDNGFEAERRTIDISGDGPNNYGRPVTLARDAALARGMAINGLPILIRPSPIVADIVRYYSGCVIGGPGSFVLPVRHKEEFAEAIRRKLVLEVATRPAGIVRVAAEPPVDCLAGEKARDEHTPFYPELDN